MASNSLNFAADPSQNTENTPVRPRQRSREDDICYSCWKKGHWSPDCPTKAARRRVSYEQSSQKSNLSSPICRCGAGKCRVIVNEGRRYFVCHLNKGQGACGFKQQCDLLENRHEVNEPRAMLVDDTTHLTLSPKDRTTFSDHANQPADSKLEGNEAETEVAASSGAAFSEYNEQSKLASSMPIEGEIPSREAYGDHIQDHGRDKEAQEMQISGGTNYNEHMVSRSRSMLPGTSRDTVSSEREASLNHWVVQPSGRSMLPGTSTEIVISEREASTSHSVVRSSGRSILPGTSREQVISGEVSPSLFVVQSSGLVEGERVLGEVGTFDAQPLNNLALDKEARQISATKLVSSSGDYYIGGAAKSPAVERENEYESDIQSRKAHPFANQFIDHILKLFIESLVAKREQLVGAIERVSCSDVGCSEFASRIQSLINKIDESNDFFGSSVVIPLADKDAQLQQYKDQLNSINSRSNCQQMRHEQLQSMLHVVSGEEDVLNTKRADLLKELATIHEELKMLMRQREQLSGEIALVEREICQSQQLRDELRRKIEQAEKAKEEHLEHEVQLAEQLMFSVRNLRQGN